MLQVGRVETFLVGSEALVVFGVLCRRCFGGYLSRLVLTRPTRWPSVQRNERRFRYLAQVLVDAVLHDVSYDLVGLVDNVDLVLDFGDDVLQIHRSPAHRDQQRLNPLLELSQQWLHQFLTVTVNVLVQVFNIVDQLYQLVLVFAQSDLVQRYRLRRLWNQLFWYPQHLQQFHLVTELRYSLVEVDVQPVSFWMLHQHGGL